MEGKCKIKETKEKERDEQSCTLGIKLDVDGQETTVRVGELKESEKGKKEHELQLLGDTKEFYYSIHSPLPLPPLLPLAIYFYFLTNPDLSLHCTSQDQLQLNTDRDREKATERETDRGIKSISAYGEQSVYCVVM